MLLYIIDLCLAFLFQYHRPIVLNKERHNTLFINAFIQISIYPLYEVSREPDIIAYELRIDSYITHRQNNPCKLCIACMNNCVKD